MEVGKCFHSSAVPIPLDHHVTSPFHGRHLHDLHAFYVKVPNDPEAKKSRRTQATTRGISFKTSPYHVLYDTLMHPAFLLDGLIVLNPTVLDDIGFKVHAIGKRPRAKQEAFGSVLVCTSCASHKPRLERRSCFLFLGVRVSALRPSSLKLWGGGVGPCSSSTMVNAPPAFGMAQPPAFGMAQKNVGPSCLAADVASST